MGGGVGRRLFLLMSSAPEPAGGGLDRQSAASGSSPRVAAAGTAETPPTSVLRAPSRVLQDRLTMKVPLGSGGEGGSLAERSTQLCAQVAGEESSTTGVWLPF